MIQSLGGPMLKDVFVVAGDSRQYQYFLNNAQEQLKEEIKRKQIHYVTDAGMLRGIKGARVFLTGSYFKRIDWNAIDHEIKANGHRALLIR